MSEMQVFNFNGKEVRTVTGNNEVFFVGKDVCERLGYANATDAMNRHCKGVVKRYPLLTAGGMQEVRVLSESDVMRLICSSQLPEAVKFEKWVFEEVLPAIRKTGGYMVSRPDDTPEMIMARALKVADETIRRRERELTEAKQEIIQKTEALAVAAPKVAFVDNFCVSHGTILVRDFAKHIAQALGLKGFGEKVMFQYLKDNDYLNMNRYPTQRSTDMGLFKVSEGIHQFSDGSTGVHHCSRITCKGQTYFYNKLKAKYETEGRWW